MVRFGLYGSFAMPDRVILHAALALEFSALDNNTSSLVFSRQLTEHIAEGIAKDLRDLLPGIERARLLVGGTTLDAAEILRPGFPVHAALEELGTRFRPQQTGVLAFGAHDGRMPLSALRPEAAFAASPMRYLPLVIQVPKDDAPALSQALEEELAQHGEAGTATADRIMRALNQPLEHARYMSLTDLIAMACVQFEHAGFAAHWALLETALLSPEREEQTLSPNGLALYWRDAKVWAETPRARIARSELPDQERASQYAAAVYDLRQAYALFHAHALSFDGLEAHYDEAGYLLEELDQAVPGGAAPILVRHTAPGLGTIALSLIQPAVQPRTLALGTPLCTTGLEALRAEFLRQHAVGLEQPAAESLRVDALGRPEVPSSTLH